MDLLSQYCDEDVQDTSPESPQRSTTADVKGMINVADVLKRNGLPSVTPVVNTVALSVWLCLPTHCLLLLLAWRRALRTRARTALSCTRTCLTPTWVRQCKGRHIRGKAGQCCARCTTLLRETLKESTSTTRGSSSSITTFTPTERRWIPQAQELSLGIKRKLRIVKVFFF